MSILFCSMFVNDQTSDENCIRVARSHHNHNPHGVIATGLNTQMSPASLRRQISLADWAAPVCRVWPRWVRVYPLVAKRFVWWGFGARLYVFNVTHKKLFNKPHFSDIDLRDIADSEVKITNTGNIGTCGCSWLGDCLAVVLHSCGSRSVSMATGYCLTII